MNGIVQAIEKKAWIFGEKMGNVGERLVEKFASFQRETGESNMLVMIENADSAKALCYVQVDTHYGLLVDGKPPSVQWHQNAEDFHILHDIKRVLH